MADMTFISMSMKEAERHSLLAEVRAGCLTVLEAAERSCVTPRTVYRWQASLILDGVQGLIHGNRGKPSPRKVPRREAKCIVEIVRKTYADCTAQLISEKLAEEHNIIRHPKTIARVLREAKAWESPMARSVRRARAQHRSWRERRSHRGELVQFDGSYHHWLENRGGTGEMCLLAAIDDAGCEVFHAEFAAHEGVLPVMGFRLKYAGKHGLPKSLYVDKFSTYKMHLKTAVENPDTKHQLARAMKTVGVEIIFANSSQAKGRIERLFRTFQDRLVKELRFRGTSTVKEANRFLTEKFIPAFNRRHFSIAPI
jgi:transposase